MKKLVFALVAVLAGCTTFSKNPRLPSNDKCEYKSEAAPLVQILENNRTSVTLELGDFANYFNLSSAAYKILFENKTLQAGRLEPAPFRLKIPVTQTGAMEILIYEKESSPVWRQKVFVVNEQDAKLNLEERQVLAEKYSPVIRYHDAEKYFPVSLEYLVNEAEPDEQLANEPFRLTNKKISAGFFGLFGRKSYDLNISFPFREVRKVLPYFGHADSVLKSGLADSAQSRLRFRYGKNHATVYYSVFENPKYNEIYINYHFFYSYDPKNGTEEKPAIAAHIFDRESVTVVLRSTTKRPLYTFYGAHLPSQIMAQLSSSGDVLQKWNSGRVFVNWPEMQKMEDHPVTVAALGSHGMYPKTGVYAVMLNEGQIKMLVEPAGGDRILFPQALKEKAVSQTHFVYELKDLKLEQVTTSCENAANILAYSGSTVDVLGPTNATFPPYTDREADYKNYLDPNAPLFDMSLE